MRRQVRPSPKRDLEEAEHGTNGNKRTKLLIDNGQENILVVESVKVKSPEHIQDNGSPVICSEAPPAILPQNEHTNEALNNNPSDINEHSEQIPSKMNGTADDSADNPNITQNGNSEEVSAKPLSTDSETASEFLSNDSKSNSEEQCSEDNKPMPVLSAENLELHNSESTDSFQSEGFETMKSTNTNQSSAKECQPSSSQEADKSSEGRISARSGISKSLDLDNLTLSYLEVTELEGHSDVIYSVAADGDIILSSSGDTTVRVWDMVDKSMVCNFSGHKDSVTCAHLLTQGQSDFLKHKLQMPEVSRIAITGSLDCHIKLWSVFEGHELASIYTFNGITCLGYLESESYVVIGTEGGKLELWDVCSSKVVQSVKAHEDSISDLKVIDCNIYSVSTDGAVKVWLFEDEEIYPVYTRKRRERTSDNDIGPSQWKSVAASENIMYLGDDTTYVKVLDSAAGRLRLFKNQLEKGGVCECVATDKDLLLTAFHEASGDSGGINVWRIPDMTYICTLSGEVQDVCCLAVVRKEEMLRVVSGGHQLLVWDFDFSKPPKKESEDPFVAVELETMGREIAESIPQSKKKGTLNKSASSTLSENTNNRWCNIM